MKHILSAVAVLATISVIGSACAKKDGDKDKTASAATTKPTDTTTGKPVKPTAPTAPKMSAEDAKTAAAKIFNERCSVCHGTSGKGDGAGAAALNPKPRNYTDKEWQNSVTDAQIKTVITRGGMAIGKSPLMTANPDLGKPEQAQVLDALVQKIREFGK